MEEATINQVTQITQIKSKRGRPAGTSNVATQLLKLDDKVDLNKQPMSWLSLDAASVLLQHGKALGPRELYLIAYIRAKTYVKYGKAGARWLRVPATALQRELGLSTYPQLHRLLMGLRDLGLLLIQEPDSSGLRGYLLNPEFEKASTRKQEPDAPVIVTYKLDDNGLIRYIVLSNEYGEQRKYKTPKPRCASQENGKIPSALSAFVRKCKRKFKESLVDDRAAVDELTARKDDDLFQDL